MLISSFDYPYQVEAEGVIYESDRVLVHRPLNFVLDGKPYYRTRGWVVTHRVSGCGLVCFRRKNNALKLARTLDECPVMDYHSRSVERSRRVRELVRENQCVEGER